MYSDGGPGDASMFAGGGFMLSQAEPMDFGAGDGGVAGGRRKGSSNSGLLPLTVKMLNQAIQKASDDNFYIDCVDVNNVTLVGMVHNKDERSTDVTFQLDDGTGHIEVKRWIDGQELHELKEMELIQNLMYVRIHGHLRSFQGKQNIVAFSVRPITDFNEITFHFLEVIYVHLANKRTQGSKISTPGATPTTATTNGVKSFPLQYTVPPGGPVTTGGFEACRKRVLEIFEEPPSLQLEQGLHIDVVVRGMAGFTKQQVREAIDYLVNEGYVYSTIDDDHYKSTTA